MRAAPLVLLCCIFAIVSCETIQAKGGPWSRTSSWVSGKVPAYKDDVIIPNGVNITLDTQTASLTLLSVEAGGSLIFDNGKGESDTEISITVETFFVAGYLEMGTDEAPLARPARVVLVNYEAPVIRALDGTVFSLLEKPYGKKVLLVHDKGVWTAHAKGRNPVWTKLTGSVKKGDTSLTLLDAVDWKVGDLIMITSTDYNPFQTERRYIKTVNGRNVTLDQPLQWGHFGEVLEYAGFPVDMRAEVGVLTSNLKIYGDMYNSANYSSIQEPAYAGYDEYMQFGGHTASVHNTTVTLEGIEMFHMGQGSRLGRYPVHWHYVYDAPGQYLKRSALRDMYARCVSIHTTNFVRLEDVICYDTYGHSVYQEDGEEWGNEIIRVLAVISRSIGDDSGDIKTGSYKYDGCSANPPGLRLQHMDSDPSGFWITNTNVTMRGNVAVGHAFGYWVRVEATFAEPDYAHGCPVCPQGCARPGKSAPTANFNQMVFEGNTAHSNEVAWWVKENWVPGDPHKLQNFGLFTIYKNGNGVMNYGTGNMNWSNVVCADTTQCFQSDWTRSGKIIVSNSIFIKETTNYGNPNDTAQHTVPAGCSSVYPEEARSWIMTFSERTLNFLAIQIGDGAFSLENVYFVNYKPNCREQERHYQYHQWCGTTFFPYKRNGVLPVTARQLDRLWFINSTFVNSYNSTCNYYTNTKEVSLYSGFRDTSGSVPCGQAGSYWMWPNTPEALPDDCTYYDHLDMYNCPPFQGTWEKVGMGVGRGYGGGSWPNGPAAVQAEWECGKKINLTSGGEINLRTDKNYVVDLEGNIPSNTGIVVWGTTVDFNGTWITFRLPGKFQTHYVYYCSWPPTKGFVRHDDKIKSECHCGVTWIRAYIPPYTNFTDGPRGCNGQVLWDANDTMTCDDVCGNPWPIETPSYTCGQKLTKNTTAAACGGYKIPPAYTGLDSWKPGFTIPMTGMDPTDGVTGSATTDETLGENSASMVFVSLVVIVIISVLF